MDVAAEESQTPRVWKVLMIGNSYTYFNNLPKMFEQVALADQPPRRVQCEMIVKGGATLQEHWDEGKAVQAIRQGPRKRDRRIFPRFAVGAAVILFAILQTGC